MTQAQREDLTISQKMRGRKVSHEEAKQSAKRLVNSHFHNKDSARVSIPAHPADDDLVVTDYIAERKAENERMRDLLLDSLASLGGFGDIRKRLKVRQEIESFLEGR